jgi:inner membrane protein
VSPVTHLFASWLIAAHATDNPRDRMLVTVAGIAPDLDGAGIAIDLLTAQTSQPTAYYADYHHFLFHGAFGSVAVALFLAVFARSRWKGALLCIVTFHLHILCDLLGSRGPSPEDLWGIFYLGPFSRDPMWIWSGQWRLDGWQNRVVSLALFAWCLVYAVRHGCSVVGIVSRKADAEFVRVLRKWLRLDAGVNG